MVICSQVKEKLRKNVRLNGKLKYRRFGQKTIVI
jgi:hypothetical protein